MKTTEIREKFLNKLPDIIERVTQAYIHPTPGNQLTKEEESLLKLLWPTVDAIIRKTDDPVKIKKLAKGDTESQVEEILTQVAGGVLTPNQGKEILDLIQSGVDITELPKLIAALEQAD